MPKAILGRKIGMTRLFDESENNVPVTAIEVGPCYISQIKSVDTDGYNAVQLAYQDVKPRNSTFPLIGHDAKAGLAPKRYHREIRLGDDDDLAEYELGQAIEANAFEGIHYVDVIGTSKGKGFAGAMKRHNFKGQPATHGVKRVHRSTGSIGPVSSAMGTGSNKKGIRMPGQMGNNQVTVRSLPLVAIDEKRSLLLVKGPVPGAKRGLLEIREAKRLYRRKAKQVAKAS
jgi:large subunit ribosomal protein L3